MGEVIDFQGFKNNKEAKSELQQKEAYLFDLKSRFEQWKDEGCPSAARYDNPLMQELESVEKKGFIADIGKFINGIIRETEKTIECLKNVKKNAVS